MSEFVRKGDRFRVLDDMQAKGLIHWRAPLTTGFECTLPRGTVLVVELDPRPDAGAFACVPERYRDAEAMLVPAEDRASDGYDGYHLVIPRVAIGKALEPVDDEA